MVVGQVGRKARTEGKGTKGKQSRLRNSEGEGVTAEKVINKGKEKQGFFNTTTADLPGR